MVDRRSLGSHLAGRAVRPAQSFFSFPLCGERGSAKVEAFAGAESRTSKVFSVRRRTRNPLCENNPFWDSAPGRVFLFLALFFLEFCLQRGESQDAPVKRTS